MSHEEEKQRESFHEEDAGADFGPIYTVTPDDDRRLLRKIDFCLLPIMAISFMFQFLDKSALGYAAILGFREQLNLSGSDFSWASGIYYVGYLVASYPVAFVLIRWRVAKLIFIAMLVWASILMLMTLCTNAQTLLTARFFLGVSESMIAPGLTIIISMWYKRSEQPLRHAGWFLGNQLAGVVGGLAAYGISHITSIEAWKAVFLIFGGATAAWSFVILFLLPDIPMTARFLSKSDREKAVCRVKENLTGIKSNEFKWCQCREALFDIKVWLIAIIQLAGNIPNGAVQSFGPIVITGLGFKTLPSFLLQSASFVPLIFIVLLTTGGSTLLTNCRTYFMVFNLILAITGSAMVRYLSAEHIWARYAGYCLTISFAANFPLIMALCTGNFGGFTKKTIANAAQFIAYCVGNIVGPQLFIGREAPSYPTGFTAIMICFAVSIFAIFVLRFYLVWENRRRDRLEAANGPSTRAESEQAALHDKTDKELLQFRYVY